MYMYIYIYMYIYLGSFRPALSILTTECAGKCMYVYTIQELYTFRTLLPCSSLVVLVCKHILPSTPACDDGYARSLNQSHVATTDVYTEVRATVK